MSPEISAQFDHVIWHLIIPGMVAAAIIGIILNLLLHGVSNGIVRLLRGARATRVGRPCSSLRNSLSLAGFIVVTFCAPLLGVGAAPGAWYVALNKPAWNPPAWIFGPAWTLLYMLMAVAAWLVWKRAGWRRPLMLYFIQLALNAAWTPIFFGAHALGWALAEIVVLWAAILLTLLSFHRVHRPAGWLLVPYLAWVTFAAILSFTLWRLNPA